MSRHASCKLQQSRLGAMANARPARVPMLAIHVSRQCIKALPRRSFAHAATRPQYGARPTFKPTFVAVRWHSAPASNQKVYDFDQVKQLSSSPSPDRILIGALMHYNFTKTRLLTLSRRSRTLGIQRWLHPKRNKHSHQVTTRRFVLACGRI